MGKKNDIAGQKFNRLTPLFKCGINRDRRILWKCRCECGNYTITSEKSLKNGNTQSCGCLQIERTKKANTKHGHSRRNKTTQIYSIWCGIIQRCNNQNHKKYKDYGGRGIKICKNWLKFENFLRDMGNPPTNKHQIDRIDNNKGYSKNNCRWATTKEQMRNTRWNHLITFRGKTQPLSAWSEELNINYDCLERRINLLQWPIEKSFTLSPSIENHPNNRYITFNNKTQCIKRWAEELGINYSALLKRLKLNWPIEKAFTTPIRKSQGEKK